MRFPILETVEQTNFFTGKIELKQVKTLIAVREYFPNTFRTAYRQRARWVLGQAFQGWQQLGWEGSLARKYLFFRDRKSVVTPFVGFVAYLLLLNVLLLYAIHWAGIDYLRFPEINMPETWVYEVATINIVLFTNRILHRMYFTWKLHGIMAGLRVLPHIVVGNLINFMAVSRAWKLFIIHLYTGKKIGWDKTAHTFLEGEAKAYRKVGEILNVSNEQCAEVLVLQSLSKMKFGQICLEKGWVSVDHLADALADQAHLWRGELSIEAAREYAHYLPFEVVKEHQTIPFALGQTGALHLAVTHLCSDETQSVLAKLVRQEVLYFVVPDYQFEQVMQLMNCSGSQCKPTLDLSSI
jgi:adsorption protein B